MPNIPGEIVAVLITSLLGGIGWVIKYFIDKKQKNDPINKEYDFFITPLKEEITRLKYEYNHCLTGHDKLSAALDVLREENLQLETRVYSLQREINKLKYDIDLFSKSVHRPYEKE